MLNCGKKLRASRDKRNKYSNSWVVRKKISERNKKTIPPPFQVKWSVPKATEVDDFQNFLNFFNLTSIEIWKMTELFRM